MIVQESVSRHIKLRKACLAASLQIRTLRKERDELLEEVNFWRASQSHNPSLREPMPPNEALNQNLSEIERESFGAFPNGFGYNSPDEEQAKANPLWLNHSHSDSDWNANLTSTTLPYNETTDSTNPVMLAEGLDLGDLNIPELSSHGEASMFGPDLDIYNCDSHNMTLPIDNSLLELDHSHTDLLNLETIIDQMNLSHQKLNSQNLIDYWSDNSTDLQQPQGHASSNLPFHNSIGSSANLCYHPLPGP